MDERIAEVRDFAVDHDHELHRSFPFEIEEVRDSANGIPGSYSVKGTAVVYDQWSLDLGGFREKVAAGALTRVLKESPHVVHTWDHDTSKALSSTTSRTYPLELRENQKRGVDFYSRVAPTSYASDLRILLDGDVVNQSSFAFTVKEDRWEFIDDDDGEERIERTILEVDQLFDVTTTALGAYPQTDSELAMRSLATKASRTLARGAREGTTEPSGDPAPDEIPEETPPAEPAAPVEDREATVKPPDPPVKPEDREAQEREFKLWQQKRAAEHRRTREFAFGVTPNKEDEA